jgi:hypothetical protein
MVAARFLNNLRVSMQSNPSDSTTIKKALEGCRRIPIERAHGLTPEVFYERYLTGIGKPVIVTDELSTWNARSKWSFDFFKSRYGSDTVRPAVWPGDRLVKLMTLADFLNYVEAPSEPSQGFWIDPETRFPRAEPPESVTSPLYLYGWRGFILHPELLADIEQSPKFVEDWFPLLPAAVRKVLDDTTKYFSVGLLIGPEGSKSNLHQDFLHSHAYLAQITGRKRCVLFSPEDSPALYGGSVDPDRPELDRFPRFRNATAYECVLEPGEMLFMPWLWWHQVVALEKSITVNYNFFNRVNFTAYLTEVLQNLPTIVAGIEKLPDAKAALGIDWVSKGFDIPTGATK